MKILNTKYSIKPSNYTKRTPIQLKKLADIGLLVGLIADSAFLNMPDFAGKDWLEWAVPFFAMTFKLITTFISEHQTE